MLNPSRLVLRFAIVAIALFVGGQARAQFVIDNFNTNQTLISVSAAGSSSSTQRGTMQGNERDLKVTVTSPGTITGEVRNGRFTYTQDASAAGSAEIVWDGIDGDGNTTAPTGLGTLNFTASSQNAFVLGVLSCNQPVNVTLTVYSSSGTSLAVTISVPALTFPNHIRIPYNTFSGTGNFTTVGAVTLTVNSSPGANLVVDFLRTYDTTTAALVENYLTDVVLVDNDGNGIASPGDKLRYSIRIKNNDTVPRTNVLFNISTPANTTLGTITATPLARSEAPAGTSAPGQLLHGALGATLTIGGTGSSAGALTNDFRGDVSDLATLTSFGVVSYGSASAGEDITTHAAGTSASFGGNTFTVRGDGGLTLVPTSTFTGLIVFQYRIANGAGTADAVAAAVAVGIRPAAVTDSYTVPHNTMINTTQGGLSSLVANDTGDQISVTANTTPAHGTVVRTGANFTYTPANGYAGADSFTYTLHNGFGDVTGTVNLTVN